MNKNPIAKVKMIRDHNNIIYYAEQEASKFVVIEISVDKDLNIARREIHSIRGTKLLALEIDQENVENIL